MTKTLRIQKHCSSAVQHLSDQVVVEEPLEIRITHKGQSYDLAVTMRTPGHDFDLVLGFLFTEGIIHHYRDIVRLAFNGNTRTIEDQHQSVLVHLHDNVEFDFHNLQRHFYASSSCGVCGKSSVEMITQQGLFMYSKDTTKWKKADLLTLAPLLHHEQSVFRKTGGNHAVGLFDVKANMQSVMEDVGRHNAMDKVIGKALKEGSIPMQQMGVILSGRVGFELVQKCWMAGIPLLMAIGAPSSLAIDLAEEVGMTVIGFLNESTFNIYSYPLRIS